MKTENEAKRVKKRLEAPPPVEDRNRDSIFSVYEEPVSVRQNKNSLWQNPKVVKLISWLLSEKDIKMVPEIHLEGKDGGVPTGVRASLAYVP